MKHPDQMLNFAEDFPDIQVTINEVGNLRIEPRDTDRTVLMSPLWTGRDQQTSTATGLCFSLVERNTEEYGRYDFNVHTENVETVSFAGQPPLSETIALAQRGISAVQVYRELPLEIQLRAQGIVNDKSGVHTLSERLSSSAVPDSLLELSEMSASERFLFYETMLGTLALKYL